jgi:hypothetical protein
MQRNQLLTHTAIAVVPILVPNVDTKLPTQRETKH